MGLTSHIMMYDRMGGDPEVSSQSSVMGPTVVSDPEVSSQPSGWGP